MEAFYKLKSDMISASIMQLQDQTLPFELMCDANNYAMGAVLGQHKDQKLHAIYYSNQTLDDAHINYAMSDKELLAIVFNFNKFRWYFVNSKLLSTLIMQSLITNEQEGCKAQASPINTSSIGV